MKPEGAEINLDDKGEAEKVEEPAKDKIEVEQVKESEEINLLKTKEKLNLKKKMKTS